MKAKPSPASNPPSRHQRYQALSSGLGGVGWISEGYVQDRGPGAGGPCYQWTRKVKGKTVSVALSKEQFEWLRQAIENWREQIPLSAVYRTRSHGGLQSATVRIKK